MIFTQGSQGRHSSFVVQRILALLGALLLSMIGLEAKMTPVVIADIDGERPALLKVVIPVASQLLG